MLVKFVKYEGAGNDFILIDDREGAFRPDAGHIAALCDRHFGIGADGLMTLRLSLIHILGFLEGGNAFESWKKFSPFKIKRSAGFGVRLYLPVVGMLGIDWGYGFDAPAGSTKKSGSQFHFVLGQQF